MVRFGMDVREDVKQAVNTIVTRHFADKVKDVSVVDLDVDMERGFTSASVMMKVRGKNRKNFKALVAPIIGYAKRNNATHDSQQENIGISLAIRDALRRATGEPRV